MGFLNPFTENLFQSVLTIDQLPENDNLLSLLLTKGEGRGYGILILWCLFYNEEQKIRNL